MSPRLVVPAAMLFSTFAWSFVFVSLPFHVQELSNSARIAAAFLGPVIATSLLAWAPAPVLYACLGAAGAACAPVGWRARA